ncbi:M14 family zinc carboxypeptidase [Maribacter chungangensis]|uniref:M14 family zinc carboxypeptidase n=1 Tax=Maribacter chungangensis TaxID=1069117 RepID=A0ABW3AZT2_9FLAO
MASKKNKKFVRPGSICPILLLFCFLLGTHLQAQVIPTPESVFGHEVGATYHLINYEQSIDYFKKLTAASDRMEMMHVGHTSEGRPWHISVISTPENLKNLDAIRENTMRIAHPEGLSEKDLQTIIKDQPVIVDINGGLHAAEIAGSQHTNQFAYELLRMDQDEFNSYFDKTVLVLWPTLNPDGQNIVVDWYKEIKDTDHPTAPLNKVYQKYVGHDNNRDGYMLNMQESRVLAHTWRNWEPEILHVHHQQGHGSERTDFHRMWLPPFATPVGVHTPPRILRQMNTLGMQMAQELETRGLRGATHIGEMYDAYYTGYNDYINMYHNSIAYWTEVDGGQNQWAEPYNVPQEKVLEKLGSFRAQNLLVSPWKGGQWNLSDQVAYMVTVNYGVLKYAKHNREDILYNRYKSGTETIENYPESSPTAYIIPQDQEDPNNAITMLRRLAFNGVKIHQLTKEMAIAGTSYPKGTWVIPTNQEFGNLVPEVLGIQNYPHIMRGDELKLPYDVAGWTLPYSMGVAVQPVAKPLADEVLKALEAVKGEPTTWDENKKAKLTANPVAAGIVYPARAMEGSGSSLALDPTVNNSYILMNRALKNRGKVIYDQTGYNSRSKGTYVVSGINKNTLMAWAKELNISGKWTNIKNGKKLNRLKIGLYQPWHGNYYDVGWTQWLLEDHEYEVDLLYNTDIKDGKTIKKYDVVIFPSIGPARGAGEDADSFILHGNSKDVTLDKYAGGIEQEGLNTLKTFLSDGGKLVFLNASVEFAIKHLNLPVEDVVKGKERSEFFGSGSLFRAEINQDNAMMSGVSKEADIYFNNSPVFKTKEGFEGNVLVSYPETGTILRSGYLMGEDHLRGNAAALEVKQGKGTVVLFGFSPQWRGQTFATFKMLFNTLHH